MSKQEWNNFLRTASHFFVSKEGNMYRKNDAGNQLVVSKEDRMYMMRAAHDKLAHKGNFATWSLILQRFWWPELEADVYWYVRTCHLCQMRQKKLLTTQGRDWEGNRSVAVRRSHLQMGLHTGNCH